ncbi:MAG: PEP-CTERM sorting domain-containing protein [Crocosphaera sp.]
MRKIATRISATVAISAGLCAVVAVNSLDANAATYNLSWEGNSGYTAEGMFSFDDVFLGEVVTVNELDNLMISFFDPTGGALASFNYPDPPSNSELNFNFNSATGEILQSGGYEDADGFDLGIDFLANELGLDFYTSDGFEGFPPVGTIVLDNNLTPQGCELGTAASPTDCEILDTGGVFVATEKVPEPASMLGLLALGAMGVTSSLKKKAS